MSQRTLPQWASNDTSAILAGLLRNKNDLDPGLREPSLLPEHSSSLAFAPPSDPDGKYQTLKVRLKQSRGSEMQARPGCSAAVDSANPPPAERRIDQERHSAARGKPCVQVVLYLDLAHLQLVIAPPGAPSNLP